MAHFVTAVRSPLPPAEAFAYLADVTHFAEWDPGVSRAVQVRGSGPGPGAAYDLTVTSGRTLVMRYEVVAFDAPRRLLLTSRTPWLESVDEVRVAPGPDGQGSIVTYDAKLRLRKGLSIFDRLLAVAFERIGNRAAAGLRKALAGVAWTA